MNFILFFVIDLTPVEPFEASKCLDLVIVNNQAVDKERNGVNLEHRNNNSLDHSDSNKPLPAIRVWESDDDATEKGSVVLTSVTAWEDDSESSEAANSTFKNFVNKATSMSNELTPFIGLSNPRDSDNNSDVELDDVFAAKPAKQRTASTKRLLSPSERDNASLSSLEDEADKPNFSSSQLIISDSLPEHSESFDVVESDDVLSNPHNVEIIHPQSSQHAEVRDSETIHTSDSNNGVRNPSYSEDDISSKSRNSVTRSYSGSRLSSNGSRLSTGSRHSSTSKVDEFEMEERSSNQEKHIEEGTGLLDDRSVGPGSSRGKQKY